MVVARQNVEGQFEGSLVLRNQALAVEALVENRLPAFRTEVVEQPRGHAAHIGRVGKMRNLLLEYLWIGVGLPKGLRDQATMGQLL